MSLVVVDADVLGRHRTGDETYVANLLRELAELAPAAGIRIAAVTRRPELVPEGIEPLLLSTSIQELRMAWTLPRLLRRVGADLVHTQYAVPLRCPCPAVVTIHDLSFERDPASMKRKDLRVFRSVVPRAARRGRARADRLRALAPRPRGAVRTCPRSGSSSPRTASIPSSARARVGARDYVLAVGSVEPRKNQLARARGGPRGRAAARRRRTRRRTARSPPSCAERGARLEGYVDIERLAELYRGAACLVQASRYEGFGLPVLEAMASGTPVVIVREPALEEVAGGAAVVADEDELADGIRRALAERDRLVWGGLERARAFSWRATAERTLEVYREVLGA